jgi:hypothetical protein
MGKTGRAKRVKLAVNDHALVELPERDMLRDVGSVLCTAIIWTGWDEEWYVDLTADMSIDKRQFGAAENSWHWKSGERWLIVVEGVGRFSGVPVSVSGAELGTCDVTEIRFACEFINPGNERW